MKIKDVKFISIKGKDYGTKIQTNPIQNLPEWQKWMEKYWGVNLTREMFNKGCNLVGDNREKFRKIFGKRNFTFKSSHYFHGWVADLGTAKLAILTAREHGSCYEVIERWNGEKIQNDINRVLEFLDMLAEIT